MQTATDHIEDVETTVDVSTHEDEVPTEQEPDVVESDDTTADAPPVQEYSRERFPDIPDVICEIAEGTFRGQFPDVPYAPGVVYEDLVAGDAEPFFITHPIAEVGIVSKNKLRYTADFVAELERQINADKPDGIRGHVPDNARSYSYPEPAIYWVGAKLVDGKLWAKGYIPEGETRREYRIKKARNAKVATSIYGKPLAIREHGDGTYTPVLELESIDLAPFKRAAHGKSYDFAVTREMEEPAPEEAQEIEEIKMDETTVREYLGKLDAAAIANLVNEETVRALATLYAERKQMTMATAEMVSETKPIAELEAEIERSQQTIAELEGTVSELRNRTADLHKRVLGDAVTEQVRAHTDWNVTTDKNKERLEQIRTMLMDSAIAELTDAENEDAVAGAVENAMNKHAFVIEMARDAIAGGTSHVGLGDNRDKRDVRALVEDPDAITEAQRRTGIR